MCRLIKLEALIEPGLGTEIKMNIDINFGITEIHVLNIDINYRNSGFEYRY